MFQRFFSPNFLCRSGVAEPAPAASCLAPEITGILMEKGREDGLRHIVANGEVRERGTRIPAKSRSALSKRSICVGQLGLGAEQNRETDGAPVECIFGGDLEFLSTGQGLVILETWRCAVIGNQAKQPPALPFVFEFGHSVLLRDKIF